MRVIGRASPTSLWHLIHYVGADRPADPSVGAVFHHGAYPGEYRTACCGYRIKVGYAVVSQITYGQPTCKNCLAKLAGLRGGPCSS